MYKRFIIIVSGALVLAGLIGLMSNARTATTLKNQILTKDTAGTDTSSDRQALEKYVYSHMNASAKLELKGSYDREAARLKAAASPGVDGSVYAQAQAACASHADSIVQARCVTDYLAKHSSPAPPATPAPVPDLKAYQYSWTSPLWTPDAAGLLLLAGVVALVAGLWFRSAARPLR